MKSLDSSCLYGVVAVDIVCVIVGVTGGVVAVVARSLTTAVVVVVGGEFRRAAIIRLMRTLFSSIVKRLISE